MRALFLKKVCLLASAQQRGRVVLDDDRYPSPWGGGISVGCVRLFTPDLSSTGNAGMVASSRFVSGNDSSSFRARNQPERVGSPAFAEVMLWLAAEQLLLLIDIFLRHVAGRDERVDAGLGHVTGMLLEAYIEKLAAKPILVAEFVVLPGAGVLYRLGDGDRLGPRRTGQAKHRSGGNKKRKAIGHRISPLLL